MSTLRMVRGDTAQFDLLVTHPVSGEPVVLDAAVLAMTAVRRLHAETHEFRVTSTGGDIVPTVGEVGRALITLPVSATSGMENEFVRLFFDIDVVDGAEHWTVDRGMLLVEPSVSETPTP